MGIPYRLLMKSGEYICFFSYAGELNKTILTKCTDCAKFVTRYSGRKTYKIYNVYYNNMFQKPCYYSCSFYAKLIVISRYLIMSGAQQKTYLNRGQFSVHLGT